jgi:tetratricopeptide (TPR) repeat protein
MTEQPSDSSSDRTWYQQGLTQMDRKQYEVAIASFDRAIECEPNSYDVWYVRGNALFNLKRYEEAFASYDRAANLQPDSFVAWESRGLTLERLQRYEEAIASFDRALAIQADEFKVWWVRGNALYGLERTEEAITDYDRALQLQPDSHQIWLWRGKILTAIKRHQEALFSYEKALEIQREIGDRRAEVYTLLNLATAYPMNGKIRKGFLTQKRAIEIAQELNLAPDDPLSALASQNIKFPSEFDSAIEKMSWAEKLINFGRQGKFQLGIILIVWLLYFCLSVAFSLITLVLWCFRKLIKRT